MHPYLLELALSCAIVDAGFTWHRMRIHPALELNLFVRWIARGLGIGLASFLGVLCIQSLISVGLALVQSPIPLSMYAGAGLLRSWMQLKSIELEDRLVIGLQPGSPGPLPSPGSRRIPHPAEKHYGQC